MEKSKLMFIGNTLVPSPVSARPAHHAMSTPSPPPAAASTTPSLNSWRTSRARLAPTEARIANSRRRAVARASSRFATFAHAIRSTRLTAASSPAPAARMYPSSMGWKRTLAAGTTLTVTFSLVTGYSARSRATIVSICARASSMVRPLASRPFTNSQRVPRRSSRVAPGIDIARRLHAREDQAVDHHQRHPELGRNAGERPGESGWRDAHDRVVESGELERLPDDVGTAAQGPLPQAVADDDDRDGARRHVLVFAKPAPERRPDAEQIEVVGGDGFACREKRPSAIRDDAAHVAVASNAGERVGAALNIEEIGVGRGELRVVLAQAAVDLNQSIGLGDRGVAQQHGVDDGEERDVEADAQGQRPDGRGREPRAPDQLPDAVPQIPEQDIHRMAP